MSILWQSSGFWLMICMVLFFLVSCIMLGQYITRQTDASLLPGLTGTPFPTFFPRDISVTPLYPDMNFHIFQPGINRYNIPRMDSDFRADSLSCYGLPGGELSCLGQIWNNSSETPGDTQIQLAFFDDAGHKLGEEIATSEQRITPPGSFTPYRMTLNTDLANEIDNTTHIIPSIMSLPPDPAVQVISIAEASGMMTESGYYDLTVTIQNNSGFDVENIRLFAVLNGNEWDIVGYSVHEVENILLNGGQQSLHLEVIPHVIPRTIVHNLHAEAIIHE